MYKLGFIMNNQYNVSLIIEDSLCSKIYAPEIEKLKENFYSKFTTVKEYIFKEQDKKLVLDNVDAQDNHLVFIISSTCSPIWNNDEMYNFIEKIQSSSLVNIINLLPERMWRNLPMDTRSDIVSTLPSGIKNNLQIEKQLLEFMQPEDLNDCVLLPHATIDAVDELLSIIRNGGTVNNACLYKRSPFIPYANTSEITPAHKVATYRQMVSQDDYSLAIYFSIADSFTISDIDFVRQHMLPSSDKSSIAAFMLGGLIEKAPAINNDQIAFEQTSLINEKTPQAYSLTMSYSGPRTLSVEPEQRYKIKESLSAELFRALRYSEEHAIKVLLHEKKNQDAMNDYANEIKAKPKM